MPDGKIIFSTDLDNKEMEKKLSKLSGKIEESEKKLNDKKVRQSALKTELKDAISEAKKTEDAISQINTRISELQSIRDTYGIKNPVGLSEAQASLKEQTAILNQQNKEAERIGNQYTKITDSVIRDTESLNGMKAQAAEITDQLAQAEKNQSRFNEAIGDANKRFAKLQSRITKLASRALIFSVITAGLRKFREYIGDVISANDEASAAIARLKGSLLTLAQPLVEVIIPAFTTFVNILTRVISLLSRIVSRIFGKTAEQSSAAAKALYEQRKALNGVGKAASSASKSLAGFDEINNLQSNDSGGGASSDIGTAEPDFSGVIDENISGIEAILGGALLVIGAILAFSGANIPLGIGLMAAGALTLADAIVPNWDTIQTSLQGPIGVVTGIVSAALLVLGIILLFTGAGIPLGLGLIAVGAAGLAATIAPNWNYITDKVQEIWDKIKSLWGTVATWFDENVIQPVSSFFSELWETVSGLASDAWESIKEFFAPAIDWFSELWDSVSQTFSDIFYNIGVIASGCWDIIQEAWSDVSDWFSENITGPLSEFFTDMWEGLKEGAKEAWDGVKSAFSTVADFFEDIFGDAWQGIVDVFSPAGDIFVDIKDGILTGFKDVVNGIIDGLNKAIAVPFNGINWALDKIRNISILGLKPFSSISRISIPSIPRLAQGAVIPPNREFMAVLGDQKHGTNVEAPLSTIQEAVAVVMDDMIGGMMAGFESNQSVLQAILEAVNTIDTSDERYANAVDAYHRKVAVAKGV